MKGGGVRSFDPVLAEMKYFSPAIAAIVFAYANVAWWMPSLVAVHFLALIYLRDDVGRLPAPLRAAIYLQFPLILVAFVLGWMQGKPALGFGILLIVVYAVIYLFGYSWAMRLRLSVKEPG